MNTQDQNPLEQYWGMVRRWWWLIVASVLVASASSYYTVSRAPRIYQATSTVMIGQSMREANPDYSDIYVSERLAQTYINMVQRQPILQGAAAALGLPYAPAAGNVSARLVAGTQLIEISVRDSSPERARDLADEVARQLILQTPTDSTEDRERRTFVQEQLAQLEQNIEVAQAEIADEQARLDAASSARAIQQYQSNIVALRTKLSSYQSSYALLLQTAQGGTNYISVFEWASTPTRPVSPRVMETVMLAAAIGLVLALGGAFLAEFLDDAIRSVDDATRASGLPALGTIPRIRGEEDRDRLVVLNEPRSGIAEAFRTLRTNIRFASVDRPLRTLMVTSPDPMEGKSLILANLAVALAQEGRSVIVVDADLRRPKQHTLFGLDNEHGLCDAFLEEHPDLSAYMVRLPPETLIDPFGGEEDDGAQQAVVSRLGDLRILASGPLPPSPADLLGSERMAALIECLTREADVVLLDSPPVLAVADAIVLSRRVDGVVLLANVGLTSRARTQRAAENMRQVDAPLLGVVVNRVTSGHRGHYYYYYESDHKDGQKPRRRRHRRSGFRLHMPVRRTGGEPTRRHDGREPTSMPLPDERPIATSEPAIDAPYPPSVETAGPAEAPRDAGQDRVADEAADYETTQPIQVPPEARQGLAMDEAADYKATRRLQLPLDARQQPTADEAAGYKATRRLQLPPDARQQPTADEAAEAKSTRPMEPSPNARQGPALSRPTDNPEIEA